MASPTKSGDWKKKRTAKLIKRDGELCWLCGKPMHFDGLPNRGKAATIEHLTPRSMGGTWALENLCLCHVGCNRHLGARPREQKEKMRLKRLSKT